MKVLYSWLRDFVEVPVAPSELATRLALCGFEVASVEPPPEGSALDGDAVLDLEITANRPDCLSVVGIAREVAMLYGLPLRLEEILRAPAAQPAPAGPAAPIQVAIDEPDLCPRYVALAAEVTIHPSPPWLQYRLRAAGLRPINNIVDITNYVMIELGHPMHAFDGDRLAGRELRVRRAHPGERLRTLDGEDRPLAETMLVIADRERAQAIAGVMGGAATEVGDTTKMVVFESAYFEPVSVRRTSRRLGLSTEASYRFERGADIEAPPVAMHRALTLLEQLGAGRPIGPPIDCYPRPRQEGTVRLRATRLRHVLGTAIDPAFVETTLTRLGFRVTREAGTAPPVWSVGVPTRRVDVTREEDLIEEVARHYGLDRLPATFPPLTAPPAPPEMRLERERFLRHVLTAAGFSEAMTFSFIPMSLATAVELADRLVPLANPLSAQYAVLRPSLVPGLLEALAYNRRRQREDVRLFEIGRRFTRAGEQRAVALAWLGAATPEHWSGKVRPVDLFDLKGVVERLLDALGVEATSEPTMREFLVRGQAAALVAHPAGTPQDGAVTLAVLGRVTPAVAQRAGLEPTDAAFVAEVDLDAVEALARPRTDVTVAPLPRSPAVVRDLSVLVDERLPAATVRGTIRAAAPDTLVRLQEFDRYQGPGIPAGRVSLSFHLVFQAPDRTLTDAEVQAALDRIVAALAREHGATRR